jgi:hypothetical protein
MNKRAAKSDKKIRYAAVGLGNIAQMAVLPAFEHATESRSTGTRNRRPRPGTTSSRPSSYAARSAFWKIAIRSRPAKRGSPTCAFWRRSQSQQRSVDVCPCSQRPSRDLEMNSPRSAK